jgi:hypothetical protein
MGEQRVVSLKTLSPPARLVEVKPPGEGVVHVFLRFVASEIDCVSGVEAGVFVVAYDLYYSSRLPDYETEQLRALFDWFDLNLEYPTRFSRSKRHWGAGKGVCWFKPTANAHLSKIHEMIFILENNGVLIRMIKASKVGYVVYEDEHQIVAEPFSDTSIRR